MAPGDLCRVASVGNNNPGSTVHQMLELEYVALIGWGEVQTSKSVLGVNAGMQLEAVMPALVVAAKGRYALGDLVTVSAVDLAHWQHGTVGKPERCRSRQRRL